MSDIKELRRDSRETKVLDEPLGGIEADVTETDLVVAALC
jgi:hypothetical protein